MKRIAGRSIILASLATGLLLTGPGHPPAEGAQFSLEKGDDGVTVNLDGKLMTRYIEMSGSKPILWPVIGPTGSEVTRRHPITEALPAEREDHPHHRSFWYTHGNVNGMSFWHEGNQNQPVSTKPRIVHREYLQLKDGEAAVISTRNDWLAPDGEKQCEDERTLTFGTDGEARWIDFDITISAADKPVTFGDTKEGSFGVRVAGTMKVDADPGGTIVNSEGDKNKEAWGKAACWVDYYGPVDGKTVGIAILNHPNSFRYPTHWHVRTYGLFAANPFGLSDFLGGGHDGSHTLEPGESMTFHYRVYLHEGDTEAADIAAAFEKYSKTDK